MEDMDLDVTVDCDVDVENWKGEVCGSYYCSNLPWHLRATTNKFYLPLGI